MPSTLNIFPARVAIGKVQQDGSVLMTAEFARALADLMVRVGGSNSMSTDEIAALASIDSDNAQLLMLQAKIEALNIALALMDDPSATIRYILTRYAPLQSPAFTGTPTAPTAGQDTNTKQLATCEFFINQAGDAAPAMNGNAAAGTSTRFARVDHVHPSDNGKQNAITPGTVTGSRGGNAALASLLGVLAAQGLINNSTTA